MTTSLTIQQTAAATGLTAHTLRYYERIGLLDPVTRQDNKHRLFREEDLLWIAFLVKLRSTGLPIRDMLHYAQLSLRPEFDHIDGGNDDLMNRILWFAAKGNRPYPAKLAGKDPDDK